MVDFGVTAAAYARHRQGYPPAFFERLGRWGVGRGGQRVVDLGAGAAALARELARRGADVVAVDRSAEMLAAGAALPGGEGVRRVVASAEATGLDADCADVVTASQCWHWFDRPAAAAEVARLLVPGGRAVIAHLDWLACDVLSATLALAETPRAPLPRVGDGLYPAWLADLGAAGFVELETFSFDVDLVYSHEAWRGRMAASAHGGASLDADAHAAYDGALAEVLRAFPDPVHVPHRVFAATGVRP